MRTRSVEGGGVKFPARIVATDEDSGEQGGLADLWGATVPPFEIAVATAAELPRGLCGAFGGVVCCGLGEEEQRRVEEVAGRDRGMLTVVAVE